MNVWGDVPVEFDESTPISRHRLPTVVRGFSHGCHGEPQLGCGHVVPVATLYTASRTKISPTLVRSEMSSRSNSARRPRCRRPVCPRAWLCRSRLLVRITATRKLPQNGCNVRVGDHPSAALSMSASPRFRRLTVQGFGNRWTLAEFSAPIQRLGSAVLLAVRRIHIGLWVLTGPRISIEIGKLGWTSTMKTACFIM